MSALGDYIHYNTTNYLRFGTRARSPINWADGEYSNYTQGVNRISYTHERLVAELATNHFDLKEDDKIAIRAAARSIMGITNDTDPLGWNTMYNDIIKYISDKYGRDANRLLHRNGLGGQEDIVALATKLTWAKKRQGSNTSESKSIKLGTLTKRIRLLQDRYRSGILQGDKVAQEITAIEGLYNELMIQVYQMYSDQKTEGTRFGGAISFSALKGGNSLYETRLFLTEQGQTPNSKKNNIVTKINRLVNNLLTQIIGATGERVFAIAVLHAFGQGIESVSDTLQSVMTGEEGSRVSFSFSNKTLARAFRQELTASKMKYDFVDNKYVVANIKESQDKVDAAITLPQGDFLASIKNINLAHGRDISLVGGTSLLTILNYADGTADYANHMLNILAARYPAQLPSELINIAKQSLIETALALALVGFKGDQRANVFILNDSSAPGNILIITMMELFQRLAGSDGIRVLWSHEKNATDINEIIQNLHDANSWIGSWDRPDPTAMWQRIAKILAVAHQQKLKVTLTAQAAQQLIQQTGGVLES